MTVRKNSSAVVFICLMGIVSLFADMTQEGARGIFGAYLGMMGGICGDGGIYIRVWRAGRIWTSARDRDHCKPQREILGNDCRRLCAGGPFHTLSCFCT